MTTPTKPSDAAMRPKPSPLAARLGAVVAKECQDKFGHGEGWEESFAWLIEAELKSRRNAVELGIDALSDTPHDK